MGAAENKHSPATLSSSAGTSTLLQDRSDDGKTDPHFSSMGRELTAKTFLQEIIHE